MKRIITFIKSIFNYFNKPQCRIYTDEDYEKERIHARIDEDNRNTYYYSKYSKSSNITDNTFKR